jgi:hypothetical protein
MVVWIGISQMQFCFIDGIAVPCTSLISTEQINLVKSDFFITNTLCNAVHKIHSRVLHWVSLLAVCL